MPNRSRRSGARRASGGFGRLILPHPSRSRRAGRPSSTRMRTRQRKGKGRMAGKVTSLVVYPVKGCAGTALGEARLRERGLEPARRWTVVDRHGRFVTQRELPALARVRPSLEDGRLRLSLPAGAAVEVPAAAEGQTLRARVGGRG